MWRSPRSSARSWHLAEVARRPSVPGRPQSSPLGHIPGLRVLLAVPDGLDTAQTGVEATRLVDLVDAAALGAPALLLHGEGSSCWPAVRIAARLGLDARIGLEDTLELPDGSPAPDNAALVTAARRLVAAARGPS